MSGPDRSAFVEPSSHQETAPADAPVSSPTERLAEAGIEPSVGSVGDSYDKALAETINGLYKAGVIHRRGLWRSFDVVKFATLEWLTGSTIDACWNPSETFRQLKPNNATIRHAGRTSHRSMT
tara:strand:- start:891 stop:1259 length:369 start_codon:yes stop_codon:yes gene_type:complete